MKLASLNQGRDGVLIVVSRDLTRAVVVPQIAFTLQAALDDWAVTRPKLEAVYQRLNDGLEEGAFAFDQAACHSPLPRAYHWADGSAYVNHVELVRKARGAEMPESFWHDPLMYQGGADAFIPPHSPIRLADEAWGIDLEAELAVITDDVPMAVTPAQAAAHIQLIGLVNDVYPDAEASLAAARATAAEIAANPPLTVHGIKDVLDEQRTAQVSASLRYVAAWNSAFLPSKDLGEGIKAMFEKRPPNFTGE